MTMNRIMEGDLHIPSDLPSSLRQLIGTVLRNDPTARPSLADIEQSEWMRGYS